MLEGGGNRGIFTSGVLDAFMEAGVTFPYVIGQSYGSCNGASFIAGNFRRQHDMIIKYTNDKRYMSVNSLVKNGQYLNLDWDFGELSYELMPLNYDNYENSGSELCVVTSNAQTAKAQYFYPKSLREWGCLPLKASCAMPLATNGVSIDGTMYFDGGITDSIPLKKAFDDGCDRAVVILTQDRDFIKQPIKGKRLIKRSLKNYPLLADALINRHIMYNEQREFARAQEKAGRALLIYPKRPLECSSIEKNTNKLEVIYKLGYMQGQQSVQSVLEFAGA